MTQTVPSVDSWAAGEKFTNTLGNQRVRDPLTWLMNPPACVAYVLSQNITTGGSFQLGALNAETYDWSVEAMHDTTSLNSRVYIPSDGLYAVEAFGLWDAPGAASAGRRAINVRRNAGGASGSGVSLMLSDVAPSLPTTAFTSQGRVWSGRFTAGDYLEIFAAHTQGATLGVRLELGMRWIGV